MSSSFITDSSGTQAFTRLRYHSFDNSNNMYFGSIKYKDGTTTNFDSSSSVFRLSLDASGDFIYNTLTPIFISDVSWISFHQCVFDQSGNAYIGSQNIYGGNNITAIRANQQYIYYVSASYLKSATLPIHINSDPRVNKIPVLSIASGLCFDSFNTLYAADLSNNTIYTIDASSHKNIIITDASLVNTASPTNFQYSIAFLKNSSKSINSLYVSLASQSVILKYDLNNSKTKTATITDPSLVALIQIVPNKNNDAIFFSNNYQVVKGNYSLGYVIDGSTHVFYLPNIVSNSNTITSGVGVNPIRSNAFYVIGSGASNNGYAYNLTYTPSDASATNVSATSEGLQSSVVSWKPPTNINTISNSSINSGYTINYGTSPSSLTQSVIIPNSTDASHTITGLADGTTYYFDVVANTYLGQAPASATVNAMTAFESTACFSKGSRILTEFGEIAIEDLQIGDKVQTLDHGLVAIKKIGYRDYYHRGEANTNHKMFHCGDLVVTGNHLILKDGLTEKQHEQMDALGWPIQKVSEKYVVCAAFCPEFEPVKGNGVFTLYDFVHENDGDEWKSFGIFANGILTKNMEQAVFEQYSGFIEKISENITESNQEIIMV